MKKIKLFFALFAMLALNVGNAWGETIVLKASDGFPSSYQSSDKTFTKSEITFGCLRTQYNANSTPTGWYKQQVIQLSKNASSTIGGDIWNVTSINIAKITVKLAANNNDFNLFYGTSAKPSINSIAKSEASSSSTETITYSKYANKAEVPNQTTSVNVFTFDLSDKGATHFLIDNGSSVNYIWEIIIETSDSSTETAVYLIPKTSDFSVVKITPFFDYFLFHFFCLSSAYLQPIFSCGAKPSQRFAYHSISTTQLMVAP